MILLLLLLLLILFTPLKRGRSRRAATNSGVNYVPLLSCVLFRTCGTAGTKTRFRRTVYMTAHMASA